MLGIAPCLEAMPDHLHREPDSVDLVITLRALAVYAMYMTHGAVRHGTISRSMSEDAFGNFVSESHRQHAKASSTVFRARTRAVA